MTQNDKKLCLTSYLSNCSSFDCGFWCMYIMIISQKSAFLGFQSLSINAKRKFWGVPHFPLMGSIFFVKLWLILSQLELSRTELPKYTPNCITMENCDHTNCPVLPVLFYRASQYGLAFWKIYLWAKSFL